MRKKAQLISNHLHHALSQVQELQQKILEKQRFKGYSGRARAISGTFALIFTACMASRAYPQSIPTYLAGWAIVFLFALLLNFGAILYWFLFDPEAKREFRRLRPTMDVLPPLALGGVLTLTFISHELYFLLYGTWMCLFGLANFASRHALPRAISFVGLYYLFCGVLLLLYPVDFLNPWPMGAVFFIGEWSAGVVLHYDDARKFSLAEFLKWNTEYEIETN